MSTRELHRFQDINEIYRTRRPAVIDLSQEYTHLKQKQVKFPLGPLIEMWRLSSSPGRQPPVHPTEKPGSAQHRLPVPTRGGDPTGGMNGTWPKYTREGDPASPPSHPPCSEYLSPVRDTGRHSPTVESTERSSPTGEDITPAGSDVDTEQPVPGDPGSFRRENHAEEDGEG
ncbi:hypothetical protein [Methanosphaerula subterraneus]|uniref:hypothetical protein n=1 Tax=Methanosphaerula subterraneus TaxID=3350244 RepID=UPI003F84BE1B